MPDVDKMKASLRRQTCAANELCAPCFNPVSGEDTVTVIRFSQIIGSMF